MTEAQITRELVNYLKSRLKGVFIKHADLATIGLPDISATTSGRTYWLEVKLIKLKKEEPFVKIKFDEPQRTLLELLAEHGRARYLVFTRCPKNWGLNIIEPWATRGACKMEVNWTGKGFERIVQYLQEENDR